METGLTAERNVLLGINDDMTGKTVSGSVDSVRPAQYDVDSDELICRHRQLHHD